MVITDPVHERALVSATLLRDSCGPYIPYNEFRLNVQS